MSEVKIRTQKKIVIPMLGFWHFIFSFHPALNRHSAYMFEFGIFKLKSLPNQGEMYHSSHYKGFWWQWEFEVPTFIFTRNFKRGSDYKKNI